MASLSKKKDIELISTSNNNNKKKGIIGSIKSTCLENFYTDKKKFT